MPAVAMAVLGYFGFHSVSGEFGIAGRERIEREVAALEAQLAELRYEREHLATRVSLLRPESLDPDMIDERARINLNVVHVNELAILHLDEPRGR
ncbi:septum formation initiator family protein [Microvirga tunisiensis]|uniref:Septum formation initiator family protein n=2 Tax=Pannonibacter tanglangensis TaxID=2750084 RepID=A0A7X5J8D5_9HYPH|nr:septum formation initiator family protein [Pannonibacter sp. XCT-34]NBN77772.1 septum formation initiator family protein [Pannonibacter sp. XCT-53]